MVKQFLLILRSAAADIANALISLKGHFLSLAINDRTGSGLIEIMLNNCVVIKKKSKGTYAMERGYTLRV